MEGQAPTPTMQALQKRGAETLLMHLKGLTPKQQKFIAEDPKFALQFAFDLLKEKGVPAHILHRMSDLYQQESLIEAIQSDEDLAHALHANSEFEGALDVLFRTPDKGTLEKYQKQIEAH